MYSTSTSDYKIFSELKQTETAYKNNPVIIMDNLEFRQWEIIRMCEFYSNSKYLKGNLDELDREKPFYNIVNYRVTIAKVATDLDIKDVQITADLPKDWVRSMFLQHESYEWMKEAKFETFLNEMGLNRAKYGTALIKKVMKDELLTFEVCDWRLITTDQVDMLGGTIIEDHFMTPSQLAKKEGVWNKDAIRESIKESTRKMQSSTAYGDQGAEEFNSDRVTVKEIHGEFPLSYYKQVTQDVDNDGVYDETENEEDNWIYSLQHYFIGEVGEKCYVFFSEEVKEIPYMKLDWEKMPGRGLGRGVIEDVEEAQVWTNDSVINEKNTMDLAARVLIKTDSKSLTNNILTTDNGKIFEIEEGEMLEAMQIAPSALGEFQQQINRWAQQGDNSSSVQDANSGKKPPADQPFATTQLLNQVATKPFDYRRQEAGEFISEMYQKWVLDYLIKRLETAHILTADFTSDELKMIDESFAIHNANQDVINHAINHGVVASPDAYQGLITGHKNRLSGAKRTIDFPEGYFDGIDAKITVVTSNTQQEKTAILTSLNSILTTIQSSYNPQTGQYAILQNPVLARIFGRIIEIAGIGVSPISLGIDPLQDAPAPVVQTATATPQAAAPVAAQTPVPIQPQVPSVIQQ